MSQNGQVPQSAYQRFEDLAKKLVRVPKKEIDQREAERKAAKAVKPAADK